MAGLADEEVEGESRHFVERVIRRVRLMMMVRVTSERGWSSYRAHSVPQPLNWRLCSGNDRVFQGLARATWTPSAAAYKVRFLQPDTFIAGATRGHNPLGRCALRSV